MKTILVRDLFPHAVENHRICADDNSFREMMEGATPFFQFDRTLKPSPVKKFKGKTAHELYDLFFRNRDGAINNIERIAEFLTKP
jgi:hypothetical protein